MIENRIAIIRDNFDLLRIIPMYDYNNSSLDLKISTMGNPFLLETVEQFKSEFTIFSQNEELSDFEISYHNSTKDKIACLHLKKTNNGKCEYVNIIKGKILDLTFSQNLPIPLFRIEYPNLYNQKLYKKNNIHKQIRIPNNNNVLEFWFGNRSSFDTLHQEYPLEEKLLTLLPIEYFALNTQYKNSPKGKYVINKRNIEPRRLDIIINNNFSLFINFYYNPQLETKNNKVKFAFLENNLSEAIMFNTGIRSTEKIIDKQVAPNLFKTTPIAIRLPNKTELEKKFSRTRPNFLETHLTGEIEAYNNKKKSNYFCQQSIIGRKKLLENWPKDIQELT
ncbi:MAG: hypothetical protein EOL97_02240 [Spirochaetia bacterium]|nr:hypothetical protein [Spirochaetia bacterium]